MMDQPQNAYPTQQSFREMPYAPQPAFPPQQSFSEMPYTPQPAFPPQQSFSEMPYTPQPAFPPQQSFGEMAYAPQITFQPQDTFTISQPYETPRNLRATRAIINGLVSLIWGIHLCYFGRFCRTYHWHASYRPCFLGLRAAKQLPGNMGRKQAIIGMAMGGVAWFIIILALIFRVVTASG